MVSSSEKFQNSPGQLWVEYISTYPDRGQAIANIHAYRTLSNMNRNVFYDEGIYTKVLKSLGGKLSFSDEGYKKYEDYYISLHDQSLRGASDGELPGSLQNSLSTRLKELESWIQENNILYSQNYDGVMLPILTGQVEKINREVLASIVDHQPNLLPAMRMAYEVLSIREKIAKSTTSPLS